VDIQLKALIDLQAVDTKLAGLEALLSKIPEELRAIRASVEESVANVERLRAAIENARKEIRTKEKELEFQAAQRSKCEAKLYEVKTNKEYSAVLTEIEQFKTQQGKIEEEILALMESQERLSREHQDASARLKVREQEAHREEEVMNRRLAELEAQFDSVRRERQELARQLPPDLLASYEKLLRHLHGLALVQVSATSTCGGCYVALPPQRLQELRQQSQLLTCESCGRYLYWLPTY
jgi:predicted  nucleic acid-binding Zn-ribbon protein